MNKAARSVLNTRSTVSVFSIIGILFLPLASSPVAHAGKPIVYTGKGKNHLYKILKLRFSPNGRRLAFVAKDYYGYQIVFLDGKPGKRFHEVGWTRFSMSSKTFAYEASDDKKSWLVINGQVKSTNGSVIQFVMSPDGSRFAFKSWINRKSVIVLDGKPVEASKSYEDVWAPAFSTDGRHFAYKGGKKGYFYRYPKSPLRSIRRKRKAGETRYKEVYTVIDGKPDKDLVPGGPGSGLLGFTRRVGKKPGVEFYTGSSRDDDFKRQYGPYDASIVKTTGSGEKMFLVVKGKKVGPYNEIGEFAISPDGKRAAFAIKKGKHAAVVVRDL